MTFRNPVHPPVVERIEVGRVFVPTARRALDPAGVELLSKSMSEIGLRTPITLRMVDRPELPAAGILGKISVLVSGAHRLAAAKHLGWKTIDCVYITGDDRDARMWEIAENLHRAELSVQDRADQVAEWMKLISEKAAISAQVEPKLKAGRPASGVNAAARELGISRGEAQRATKIAGIVPDARKVADDAGLNTQKARLEIAAAPPAEQVGAAVKLADEKRNQVADRKPSDAAAAGPIAPAAVVKKKSASRRHEPVNTNGGTTEQVQSVTLILQNLISLRITAWEVAQAIDAPMFDQAHAKALEGLWKRAWPWLDEFNCRWVERRKRLDGEQRSTG